MFNCLFGTISPCFLNASNLSAVRKEDCTIFHCLCCYSPFWVRQSLKKQLEIQRDYCDDCLAIAFCCPCAICQDSREIHWNLHELNDDTLLGTSSV